jgi:serine/threonine protein kinase
MVPGVLAWRRLVVGYKRETWLCWSVDRWDAVLLKIVRPDWSRPRSTAALGREVRALRPLNHPSFPHLVTDGTRTELPHLVTDYFDGPALDEIIDDAGRLGAEDVATLCVHVLSALRYLHATGIAHMDICPDNVVTVEHRARLIDLGSARRIGSRLAPGEALGTDGYTAPELDGWAGVEITPAMDVYSVGATLRRAIDTTQDPDGAVGAVLDRLTDPDPARRPTPDEALALLVRHAGTRLYRPWPWWGDRHLARATGASPVADAVRRAAPAPAPARTAVARAGG